MTRRARTEPRGARAPAGGTSPYPKGKKATPRLARAARAAIKRDADEDIREAMRRRWSEEEIENALQRAINLLNALENATSEPDCPEIETPSLGEEWE